MLSMEELQYRYDHITEYRVVVSRLMIGLTHMQVCAVPDATDEEILEVCNTQTPSGTTNGWVRVIREGEGKPGVCEKYPERMHFIIEC